MTRPAIPRQIERDVLVEAGHRCAIPTCRQPTIDVAHIIPYPKVKNHTFDNLIALCPNCHRRHHKNEIDIKSLKQYKMNLSVLNNRYGDLERRLLTLFAQQPNANKVKLPGGNLVFVMFLIQDGYLIHAGSSNGQNEDEFPNYDEYILTPQGRDFVQTWLSGKKLK